MTTHSKIGLLLMKAAKNQKLKRSGKGVSKMEQKQLIDKIATESMDKRHKKLMGQ